MRKFLLITLITSAIALTACGNNMTDQDKQFEESTMSIARNMTSNEKDTYDPSFSLVTIGEPEYQYTLYAADLDQYKVAYYVPFDVEEIDEYDYIEIDLITDENGKLIDSSLSHMSEDDYEHGVDFNKGISTELHKGITWTNIHELD